MRRKIYFLLFFFLCLTSIPLAAQDIEIKGMVTEATTNEPLPGVTVRVKGKDTGTVTDMDGKYSIKANKGNILVFSTIGKKQNRGNRFGFLWYHRPGLRTAGDLAAHGGSRHDRHPHESFPRAAGGAHRLAGYDPRSRHPSAAD